MKATLKNIAKNLKKSSKVHAKQSKQIENIMKKSPAKQNGKFIGKLKRKPILNPITKDLIPKPLNKELEKHKLREDMRPKPVDPKLKKHMFKNTLKFKSPAKNKAKNLLKAVPNKAAFDKLSPEDKKGFTKAAKKAGLPTKNITSALKMKKSPALAKLSASCKAAAKRKFKVYPSAYANMWAAKTQRQGKC